MNQRDYLNLLRFYLKEMPELVVNDIISDYEEHFRLGLANGKTEEQIVQELGSAEEIAREFLGSNAHYKHKDKLDDQAGPAGQAPTGGKKIDWLKWIAVAIAGIVLAPVVGSLLIALVSMIFAGFVTVGAIAIAVVAVAAGLFISIFIPPALMPAYNIHLPWFFYQLSAVTRVAGTVFFLALGVMIAWLAYKFVVWAYKSIRNLIISIRWKWRRRS